MRHYRTPTSKGSFLAILKQLHRTHLHPNLPFTIVSTSKGLAIRSRTVQFKRLSDALVGHAQLIPIRLTPSSRNDRSAKSTTVNILAKFREFVSIVELEPEELYFAVWGTFALVNHRCHSLLGIWGPFSLASDSCKSSFGFGAGFGEGYIPKVRKRYLFGFHKIPGRVATSSELAGNGKEVLAFYRTCEGESDFECEDCTKQRKHIE